jgi:outer membrane protein with glycine zipper
MSALREGTSIMRRAVQITIGLAALSVAFAAEAQKPIAYPAKGQSASQQSKDDAECYAWAKQTTGIDPAVVASSPPPQQTGPAVGGGQRLRGAARGAAGGAAIGAIAGDAGQGAGIGAIAGTMVGGREARQQRDAQNQQAVAQQQEVINTFYRAFGACMEGRGYTIK